MQTGDRQIEVLIADRDESNRSALKLLLFNENNYIIITEAANIENGQGLADCHNFNLAIVDWDFNFHNTKLLIDHLRQTHPNIVIIVLSKRLEDKTAALEVGAQAFIYKGDPPGYLHQTLLTYLNIVAMHTIKEPSSTLPRSRPMYCCHLI